MRKYHPKGTQSGIGWKMRNRNGFTLIELAFVLAFIGILLSMGVEILPSIIKQSKLSENRSIVKEAKTAIIGFSLARGRLPWASSDEDGDEDTGTYRGYLPYATLGVRGRDTYGKTLFYTTDNLLANTSPATINKFKANLDQLISTSSTLGPYYTEGSTDVHVSFMVLSSGTNTTLDGSNSDTDDEYEIPGASETDSYDDISDAVGFEALRGRFD